MKTILLLIAASLAAPLMAEDAAHGKAVFMKIGCWQCHGTAGQGGGYTGPKLAPNTPSLAYMKSYVRHPMGDMPPYTDKVLSDSDLADIRAYLLSIPPAPDVKALPGLTK